MPAQRIKTISQYHQLVGLPKPEHPLISLISFDLSKQWHYKESISLINDFYSIALKRNFIGKIKYGQQQYDFDEGIMTFMSPGQVLTIEMKEVEELKHSGWLLLIHPDFFWNTILAKTIRQYPFFNYAVHEALFLSDKEENTIISILQNIQQEYHSNIDAYSQTIIIAQIELLLSYAERFYNRQFITRKITNQRLLERLEEILDAWFNKEDLVTTGLPSVQHISDELHVSPGYLSNLLTALTGQSTQQHLHNKLIEKAMEKLSTTERTVAEIAYELGFEHPQSFSRLFKLKTNQSPLAFRQSFN
jgi:AraC family transcriptional regulator, transcriptional activator of pobA